MKIPLVVITALIGATFLTFSGVTAQNSKGTQVATLRVCDTLQPEPGYMKSWAGQPGFPDHSDSRAFRKGDFMGCAAFAALGSPVPPGCFLSYQNDGSYTLRMREAMNSPTSDVVTLTCNGQSPTCCAIILGDTRKSGGDFKLIKPLPKK